MTTRSGHPHRGQSFVGVFQAKTHFSQLLQRVAQGEEITITKHGWPLARLVPAARPSREHVAEVFRQMDALRESLPKAKAKDSLGELINQGRRF